jgi:hypothetical protein
MAHEIVLGVGLDKDGNAVNLYTGADETAAKDAIHSAGTAGTINIGYVYELPPECGFAHLALPERFGCKLTYAEIFDHTGRKARGGRNEGQLFGHCSGRAGHKNQARKPAENTCRPRDYSNKCFQQSATVHS